MGLESFSFLVKKLPVFKVNGSQVRIIHEPSQFYQVIQQFYSMHNADISIRDLGARVESGGCRGQGDHVSPLLGRGGQGEEAA